jgi:hypothetical protein
LIAPTNHHFADKLPGQSRQMADDASKSVKQDAKLKGWAL